MRRGAIVAALVAALGFAPVARAVAPSPPPGHPSVRRFSTADGLPHDTVYAVTRDRDGYLWIGTQNGAARYDGRRFTTFDMPDAATSNYVRDLLAARDGSLWFARQNGGVVRLKDGRTTVLGVARGLPSGRVNTVAESPGPDGAPTVFVGLHGGGVCRLSGDRFVPVETDATASWRVWKLVHARLPGRAATLLAASEEGLFALEKGRFVHVPVDTGGAKASFNSIVTVEHGESATAYLGTYGAGVVIVSSAGTTRVDATRGLPANLVTALAATPGPGGRPIVWVGTRGGGLARIDGDRARAVALDARANEVFGLASGLGDGALWVGIRAFGLARLALSPFTALDVWSGLPSDNVGDIRLVPRPGGNEIWLSTNRGVGIYRDGEIRVLDTRNGIPGREIGFFASTGPAERPDVWTGTLANGLARLRDGAPTVVLDVARGFVTDRIFALLATPEGLWVGTDLGKLVLVDPESTRTLAVVDGVPHNEVLNLARTPDGTLWAATRSGLAVVRDRKVVRLLTSADGLPNDEVLVLSILPGPAGDELWAGTRGGTARLQLPVADLASARFARVPGLPDGVANAAVQAILPDGHGNVFLGTHRGIVRISPAGVRVFTTADGVPSNIAAWGGLVDAEGRIWTSTSGGAAILDTEAEGLAPGPPAPLVIESILRNDRPVPGPASGAVLRHDESLSLELALLSFASAAGVTYRAQLVGLEPRPSEPAPAPVFRYSRLPAGRYVFRGWGRDERGVESGPVELAFSVTEAPWRSLPALALYAAAFVLAVASLLRLRTTALRARARELEALVEARTRELVAARDQALAGSRTKDAFLTNVSHELRTPLNAILGYAELLREELPGRADDLLHDVGRIQTAAQMQLGLVNEILDLSKVEAGRIELHLTTFGVDELVSTVVDTIRPLAARNGNKVMVAGSPGAGEIRADRTRLLQVLLNLLSNASKFTKDGVVTLAVSRLNGAAGEEVVFRVTDTGIGMTEVQMARLFQPFLQADASTSATYGGTGLGLVIAKRFCELMGGDLGVESEEGKGSRFTAWIPVSVGEARGRPGGARPGTLPSAGAGVVGLILALLLSGHVAMASRVATDPGRDRGARAGAAPAMTMTFAGGHPEPTLSLYDGPGGSFVEHASKAYPALELVVLPVPGPEGGHGGRLLGLRPPYPESRMSSGLFGRPPPASTTSFELGLSWKVPGTCTYDVSRGGAWFAYDRSWGGSCTESRSGWDEAPDPLGLCAFGIPCPKAIQGAIDRAADVTVAAGTKSAESVVGSYSLLLHGGRQALEVPVGMAVGIGLELHESAENIQTLSDPRRSPAERRAARIREVNREGRAFTLAVVAEALLAPAARATGGETLRFSHGATEGDVPSLLRGIRTTASDGQVQDFSTGFYMTRSSAEAAEFAEVRSAQRGSPPAVVDVELPAAKVKRFLDLRHGTPGGEKFSRFLEEPAGPGGENWGDYYWQPDSKGPIFEEFLKREGLNPDLLAGPMEQGKFGAKGRTQFVIRDQALADEAVVKVKGR